MMLGGLASVGLIVGISKFMGMKFFELLGVTIFGGILLSLLFAFSPLRLPTYYSIYESIDKEYNPFIYEFETISFYCLKGENLTSNNFEEVSNSYSWRALEVNNFNHGDLCNNVGGFCMHCSTINGAYYIIESTFEYYMPMVFLTLILLILSIYVIDENKLPSYTVYTLNIDSIEKKTLWYIVITLITISIIIYNIVYISKGGLIL